MLDSLVNINKISNNTQSILYAKRALAIAKNLKSDTTLGEAYKLMGIAYSYREKDSSYFYCSAALKLANALNLPKLKILAMYNIALLYSAAYNYKESIKLLDSTILLAQSLHDQASISRGYLALGNIDFLVHDYESAKKMYESALDVAQKHKLYEQMGVAMGNLAKFEFEKDIKKSISQQREAIGLLGKVKGTEEEMAYILINMGNRFPNPDSALFYYKSALKIAVNAHLPMIQFGAYNNMAYSYLDKKDIYLAEACLKDHAIPVALEEKDHDWLSSLYDTYADVAVVQNDYKKALVMQKNALRERITDHKEKASEQLRLLAALLDLKNKELIIQNEAQELLIQRNRLQRVELWLAIALILIIVSVFITVMMQQRNRVKFHKEQIGSARRIIEMEEAEKGRTARELHDLTGQLVMGISGTIEDIEFPDSEIKEQLKTRIRDLGASIRRISHRMNRAMIEHFTFSELIQGLCEDYTKLSGMSVKFDIRGDVPDLPNELVLQIYRITQELLTNAGKYAHESHVKVTIMSEVGKLSLFYHDDGPGFRTKETKKNSMGILNIFERAKLFSGLAQLTSEPGKGTSWEIVFPVDKNLVANKNVQT